ncbi:MAG: phosphate ABC transporter permease PstA [Alkalinema sp. RU_4_3]|nr:phosphate ABC transporter permease PstA [Alkalinema sp. RU_4_3]
MQSLQPNPVTREIIKPLPAGRRIFSQTVTVLAYGAIVLALLPLLSLLIQIVTAGIKQLNWNVLTRALIEEPSGFLNAILGTFLMVAIAAVISLPIGLVTAIYLSEFGKQSRLSQTIRFAVNILSAVPSIVAGVFAYAVVVIAMQTPSALAGSAALVLVMLPMVILAGEEALKLVPSQQRSASAALGANTMQTTFKVVVASALPGLTTAGLLAVARAMGETAPLIFTAQFSQDYPNGLFSTTSSLSVLIYNYANSPDTAQNELAWTASLVLAFLVLTLSVVSRFVLKNKAAR